MHIYIGAPKLMNPVFQPEVSFEKQNLKRLIVGLKRRCGGDGESRAPPETRFGLLGSLSARS
jgi:hypothetical protein